MTDGYYVTVCNGVYLASGFRWQTAFKKHFEPRQLRRFHRSELHRKSDLVRLFHHFSPQMDRLVIREA